MQAHPIRTTLFVLPLLGLPACPTPPHGSPTPQEPDPLPWDTGTSWVDVDQDGYSPGDGDCDDEDPAVHPGQLEVCNGRDDNCNGLTDEGFSDTDEDSVADCVDLEECDGRDNDGDTEVDEGFPDADEDSVADCVDQEECDGRDNDGDAEVDEGFDADGDGWLPCGLAEHDCDDSDPSVHPEATETSGDGRDEDCDGLIDEGLYQAGGLIFTELMANPAQVADPAGEWVEILNLGHEAVYLHGLTLDSGIGAPATIACAGTTLDPGVYAVVAAEADPRANGGIAPTCTAGPLRLSNEAAVLTLRAGDLVLDEVTWDDGATMPDVSGASLTLDPFCVATGDNDDPTCWCAAPEAWSWRSDLGSPGVANPLCPTLDHDGDGYCMLAGDCDDADAQIHPGASDSWYDGVDQDCDGWSDFDADRDGYDADLYAGSDCNDEDAAINPGMPEVCDDGDVDEDCNGLADDDDPAPTGRYAYHHDRDGDGWGSDARTWLYCDPPPFAVEDGSDCDDSDAAVSPDATEICGDATDDDCDGRAQTCAEFSLAEADLILTGADGDQTGYAIAGAGSFGGGMGLAVGAIDYASAHPDTGSACFVADPAGIIAGLSGASSRRVALSSVATCFLGETARDQAGGALDGGWDADGDGTDDLLIGALGQRSLGPMTGAAYLVLGPGPSSGRLGDADAILRGVVAGGRTGAAVAFAGDVDGDGALDLLVGAPAVDKSTSITSAGEVYLFLGPVSGEQSVSAAAASLTGETRDAAGGTALAGGADLDGDGFDDFIAGAPGDSTARSGAGAVYVFTHAPSGVSTLAGADDKLLGDQANVAAGTSLAIAGDVDGDGLEDYLVGGPGDATSGADAGAAWLITSTPAGSGTISSVATAKLCGAGVGDAAGSAVSGAGDVDGDGFADLLVSAPGASLVLAGAGEAYLALGAVSGTLDLFTDHFGWFSGEATSQGEGMQVAPAGDLDGDGLGDLLVSAPALEVASYPDGAVYVLLASGFFAAP